MNSDWHAFIIVIDALAFINHTLIQLPSPDLHTLAFTAIKLEHDTFYHSSSYQRYSLFICSGSIDGSLIRGIISQNLDLFDNVARGIERIKWLDGKCWSDGECEVPRG